MIDMVMMKVILDIKIKIYKTIESPRFKVINFCEINILDFKQTNTTNGSGLA